MVFSKLNGQFLANTVLTLFCELALTRGAVLRTQSTLKIHLPE